MMDTSSPSSTIYSADNFFTSKPSPGPGSGCFFTVLRRIFSPSGLPTYPFDQTKESQTPVEVPQRHSCFPPPHNVESSSPSPSVVARLMGLNSMPEMEFCQKRKARGSIPRSKSMNSTDWRRRSDSEAMGGEGDWRRTMMASRSLREPTCSASLEVEDDDFFVLRFDKGGRGFGFGSCDREFGMGSSRWSDGSCCSEIKPGRDSLKISNRVNIDAEAYVSSTCSPLVAGEVKRRNKDKKSNGKVKQRESHELENSSPVSVLEQSELSDDTEPVTTPDDDSRSRATSRPIPIRDLTLSVEILDEEEFPSDDSGNGILIEPKVEEPDADERQDSSNQLDTMRRRHCHCMNMSRQIHREAAEEEALNLDVGKCRVAAVVVRCEDLGGELGFQIFYQLLDELVAELVGNL